MKKYFMLFLSTFFVLALSSNSVLAFQGVNLEPVVSQSGIQGYTQYAFAYDDENNTKSIKTDKKMIRLDNDLKDARDLKNSGIWMTVGGVAVFVVGLVVNIDPNVSYEEALNSATAITAIKYGCYLVGSGLLLWGIINLVSGGNQEKILEQRKSEMTIIPYINPVISKTGASMESGLRLSYNY